MAGTQPASSGRHSVLKGKTFTENNNGRTARMWYRSGSVWVHAAANNDTRLSLPQLLPFMSTIQHLSVAVASPQLLSLWGSSRAMLCAKHSTDTDVRSGAALFSDE